MMGSVGRDGRRPASWDGAPAHNPEAALRAAFQRAAVINAVLLKLGSLEQPGLDTQRYRATIDLGIAALEVAATPGDVRQAEHEIASGTQAHLREREELLRAREEEFNATIALLADAVAQFHEGNTAFDAQVLARSERMEQISAIDDLRLLRQRLRIELAALREATAARQEQEERQIGALRARVESLEARLSIVSAQALRDPLTGLHNRIAWDQRMAELAIQLEHGDTGFALALIDLDHFKRINDTYGHAAGDNVLTEFGEFCRQAFGDDDFVARFGGDEFVVLLAAPSLEHGAEHINRLINLVRRANETRLPGGRPAFTISVGLVQAQANEDAAALLERADRALYAAKHAGRDQLMLEAA
jgi:diguanylate cyclase